MENSVMVKFCLSTGSVLVTQNCSYNNECISNTYFLCILHFKHLANVHWPQNPVTWPAIAKLNKICV